MTGLIVHFGEPRPRNPAFIDVYALCSDQKKIFASPRCAFLRQCQRSSDAGLRLLACKR
jgi:hypothetical protein